MEITLSELEAKVTEVSFIVIPIQRELFRKKNCKFDRQCHHNTANFPARAISYAKLFFIKSFYLQEENIWSTLDADVAHERFRNLEVKLKVVVFNYTCTNYATLRNFSFCLLKQFYFPVVDI
jgi:hypothetical protein